MVSFGLWNEVTESECKTFLTNNKIIVLKRIIYAMNFSFRQNLVDLSCINHNKKNVFTQERNDHPACPGSFLSQGCRP